MDPQTSTDTGAWVTRYPPRLAPRELAAAVAAHIRAHPDKWNQSAWWDGLAEESTVYVHELEAELLNLECGTTACVCGLAIALGAPPGTRIVRGRSSFVIADEFMALPDGTTLTIADMGAALLGLPDNPRASRRAIVSWVFRAERDRDEVLYALDLIAKGEFGEPYDCCEHCDHGGYALAEDGSTLVPVVHIIPCQEGCTPALATGEMP